jgi:hypothetical protein
MEAMSLISSLFIGLPVIAILLLVVAVVLQWSYKLICRRDLRYSKACKLILVLFLINIALSYLVGAITVSMGEAVRSNVDLIKLPVMFLIGAGVYARWLNAKTGRPIGWAKGLMVQGVFYAIMFVGGLLIALPFYMLMEKFGG